MKLPAYWIEEETKALIHESMMISEITESLQSNTEELTHLLSQIKTNLKNRKEAFRLEDWDTYMELRTKSFDMHGTLDWLIVNL